MTENAIGSQENFLIKANSVTHGVYLCVCVPDTRNLMPNWGRNTCALNVRMKLNN